MQHRMAEMLFAQSNGLYNLSTSDNSHSTVQKE